MALFEVSRYLGEDEEISATKEVSADDILKKIKAEAKARKKSLDKLKDQSILNESTSDNSIPVIDKSNRNKVEGLEKNNFTPKKKSKSKTEKVTETSDSEVVIRSELEDNDNEEFTQVKENKKKRKVKDTTDPIDVDDEAAEVEGSPKKKLKKDKKHKSEQDENDLLDISKEDGDEEHKSEKKKEPRKKLEIEGPTDVGGFTVLGSHKPAALPKVTRVLPEWLSHPTQISRDLTGTQVPVNDMPGLCESLLKKLQKNKITHFFPVQQQVIPALLASSQSGFHIGPAGYRPSDICVSAPTGSGKTLAFVIPIVQALQSRVTCEIRALAVLPVQDLAKQVFQVFQTYCQDTPLKPLYKVVGCKSVVGEEEVGLLTGQKLFSEEQNSLVKRRLRGYISQYDIIVATPGRLVDHINKTEGFNLSHLRYLVIDEADRMMEEIKQDWLIQVERAAYTSRPQPGPITAVGCASAHLPLQKLLYSATLSQNPEKLQQLNLFQPKLFTSIHKSTLRSGKQGTEKSGNKESTEEDMEADTVKHTADDDGDDYVGKYTTPDTLSEFTIKTDSAEKPLMVLHMLHNLKYRNILCFTNSVESTHRLYLLIKSYGGVEVREFSSGLKVSRRNDILQQFTSGKIDIIICSDAMARGMDIGNVDYVVLYDSPPFIQNYIHRIGRTARAGKKGSAFTLLQEKEFFHFKKMLREAGKKTIKEMKITKKELKPLIPQYETALKEVSTALEEQKKKKGFTPRKENKNNKSMDESKEEIEAT